MRTAAGIIAIQVWLAVSGWAICWGLDVPYTGRIFIASLVVFVDMVVLSAIATGVVVGTMEKLRLDRALRVQKAVNRALMQSAKAEKRH